MLANQEPQGLFGINMNNTDEADSYYRPLNKGYITGRMKSGAPDLEHYGKDGFVEVWVAVKQHEE